MKAAPSTGRARRFVLGLDLGTSSCKACLVDTEGRLVGDAGAGYETATPRPGWAEQNPADWLCAIAVTVPKLLRESRVSAADIAGLALTSAAHIGVLLDAAGEPVRSAILWNDQRTAAEVADLERIAGEDILAASCQAVSTGWTLPHLLWVQRHDRPAWDRVRAVMLSKDYLLKWLTGRVVTDPATAVSSQLYDVRTHTWSVRLCDLAGITPDMLPRVVPATEPVGSLTAAAAGALGLLPGTPVVAGTLDSATELLAAGICGPGVGMIRLATAGGIQRVVAAPTPDRRRITYPYALAPYWYCQAGTNTCAAAVQWGKRLCAGAADLPYEIWDAEAAAAPAGSDGLLFYPYLAGERAPHWSPFLRGGFIGLSLVHGRGHLARAIYEGTAFSIRQAMAALAAPAAVAAPDAPLAVAGGGTRSTLWVNILAHVLGRPLRIVSGADSAQGAALLALAGLGLAGADLRALAGARASLGEVIHPDPGLQAIYGQRFAAYVHAQEHLLPVLQTQESAPAGTLGK